MIKFPGLAHFNLALEQKNSVVQKCPKLVFLASLGGNVNPWAKNQVDFLIIFLSLGGQTQKDTMQGDSE